MTEANPNNNIEIRYAALPELQPHDLPDNCGLEHRGVYGPTQEFMTGYIVKALQNPQWLTVPIFTSDHRQREAQGLPRVQNMDRQSVKQLYDQTQGKSPEELLTIAQGIRNNTLRFSNGLAGVDITARSLEIMGEENPNLTFFRGTTLSENTDYTGVDFTLGDLPGAMSYADNTVRKSGGRVRKHPVVVMTSVTDVTKAYANTQLSIRTEGDWARNSIEIIFRASAQDVKSQITKIRKFPSSIEKVKAIEQIFTQKSIQI